MSEKNNNKTNNIKKIFHFNLKASYSIKMNSCESGTSNIISLPNCIFFAKLRLEKDKRINITTKNLFIILVFSHNTYLSTTKNSFEIIEYTVSLATDEN